MIVVKRYDYATGKITYATYRLGAKRRPRTKQQFQVFIAHCMNA